MTETSELDFEVSKSSIRKHTTPCDKGVFSFIIISQLQRQLSSNFHRFIVLNVYGEYTPSEKNGFRQLPIVSSVFIIQYKIQVQTRVDFQSSDWGKTASISFLHTSKQLTICTGVGSQGSQISYFVQDAERSVRLVLYYTCCDLATAADSHSHIKGNITSNRVYCTHCGLLLLYMMT